MHVATRSTEYRPFLIRAFAFSMVLTVNLAVPGISPATAADAGRSVAARAAAPDQTPPLPAAAIPQTARGRQFVSALWMWCGVLIAGLALIAMVMLWGRRLRRSTMRLPAPNTAVDPFWYLKKNSPALDGLDRPSAFGPLGHDGAGPGGSGGQPAT